MTSESATGRGGWPTWGGRPLDPTVVLILMLLAGVAVRVLIAYVLLPQAGLRSDMSSFSAWALRLADVGPGEFYEPGYFADYPPGYMYLLWLVGEVSRFLEPILGASPVRGLVKLPGMAADLGVAAMIFVIARRFLGRPDASGWLGSGARMGLIGAAVYLFNPGTIFNSAVWGQMDALGMLVILAGLYALGRGWTEAAGLAAIVAMLIKFQFGWFIPIVVLVGLKRHLFGRSADPDLDARPDPVRILSSLAVAFGSLVLLLLPFGMTVLPTGDPTTGLIDKLQAAASTYEGLSINAMNLWRNPLSGIWDVQQWGNDQGVVFNIGGLDVTWALVGVALFAAAAVVALVAVVRRDDMEGLLIGSLTMAIAFFTLPTRVHERYLFPALALAAPLVGRATRWAVAYLAISTLFFMNIYWVYTFDWSYAGPPPVNPGLGGEPMARDPLLGAIFFTEWGVYLLSFGAVVLLGWVAWQAIRSGARREPMGAEFGLEADGAATALAAVSSGAPATVGRTRWRWLRQDPEPEAERQPPRRLDRLDLLLFVVIVALALVFRLWRLDLPRSFHFDEVYHARTAAEYLSDWRWGWSRDPYEWTHPMLAKYLIAAGMVAADPNQVTGTTALEAPAPAMAIVPLRTLDGRPASIAFTSDGSPTIEAHDLDTGELVAAWEADGPVASLAWDPDTTRLLAGLETSGAIGAWDLTAFLAAQGTRDPPPGSLAIETGMRAVLQIVAPGGETILVARAPDEVAVFERVTGVELTRRDMAVDAVGYVSAVGGDSPVSARVVTLDTEGGEVQSLDASTLAMETSQRSSSPPTGLLLVSGRGQNQLIWVPVGPLPATDEHPATDAGMFVLRGGGIVPQDTVPLPAPATAMGWDPVANLVYVAGPEQVWSVMPHGDGRSGFAVFDETPVEGAPLTIGFDVSDTSQSDDHGRLVVSTETDAEGALVSIDIGHQGVAWRLMGVVFGSVLAGLVYLLTAMLFRRRPIAVLAGLFVAVDLMSYAMSRIAMNDIFVATFIVAAYALFWPIWSGRWRRGAWWVLPVVGILIGLAAASKWVGWYALLGLLVLVLLRSQLGRFVLVAAAGFGAVALGVGAPWPFTLIAFAILALGMAVAWVRPVRLAPAELWAAPATALVVGIIGAAFVIGFQTLDCGEAGCYEPNGLIELGFGVLFRGIEAWWPAAVALALTAVLLIARAARSLSRPDSDGRWFAPSEMGGFAWPWVFACLVVIPIAAYVVTYVPWMDLGHPVAIPDVGIGYGWSLEQLHAQMYGYHFGLSSGHPGASPWWSWPLDLKPVWFYSHSFDFNRVAVIYNGGNPALFWASIPAIAGVLLLAWRRRSWALLLVAVAFGFQFLPWARVERVAFIYHYLTAVLFAFIAIAYLLDEILRDRSLRDYAITFLIVVGVTGLLIYPLDSALAMPDWYVNAARTLPPWNYAFRFPDPSPGERPPLISSDPIVLAIATALSLGAAAFASFGRDLLGRTPPGSAAASNGSGQDEHPDGDQADGPHEAPVEPG